MTIHASDPFATPDDDKSALRRLRGRLAAPVTAWTAYGGGGRPAGLTVSSTVIADGEPGFVLGLLDPESQVWDALQDSGRVAVTVLQAADAQLADVLAGLRPAPGGAFAFGEWVPTPFGPVPANASAWVGARLQASRSLGYGLLVEAAIERIEVAPGPLAVPLVRYGGRYRGA